MVYLDKDDNKNRDIQIRSSKFDQNDDQLPNTKKEDLTFADEDGKEVLLDEYGVPDKLRANRSLVIRKMEIMKKQCNSAFAICVFLFTAFLAGVGTDLNSQLRSNYTTYATNSYRTHSLLSTIGVVSSIISAGALTVYARLSDVFGRIRLYLSAMLFFIIGTIIQSQATNVQKYAAGTIFYSLGTAGIQVMMFIILSDFSSLKWRLFFTFAPTWPSLFLPWITGSIVSRLNPVERWSWGIGMWAFIYPLSSVPFVAYLLLVRYKASKTEEWKVLSLEKTYYQTNGIVQTLVQLFWKIDVIGLFLFVAFLGCILVPLTLAGGVSSKWNTGNILGPFILGFFLVPLFIFWETKYARLPIAPFKMLKDRGIWSAMIISMLAKTVYYLAAGYLLTILMVAVNQSSGEAAVIMNVWTVAGCGFSPFFAYFVSRVRRLKPFITIGCGFWMASMALLYHYRSGEHSKSGIIAAMVLWGLGSTMITRTTVISSQSITSHENMATITAIMLAISRIGSGIGSAVSGAIWTQTLYEKLVETIGDPSIAKRVYQSPLSAIKLYAWGTPTRDDIVEAYRHVQRYEVIVAMILIVPLFIASLCLRDPKLTDEVAHTNIKDGDFVAVDGNDNIGNWFRDKWENVKLRRKSYSSE
ncbi:unnamed protein product [Kluyveromyces dobzhanskii CBS 2104]|uniref:WGS project CCBQ000000000 data, contig 00098 n=1 Tax=Kluyveromyces dobzhanskii CBS 2104 TaxID=1427455 RepID=A0A0A8L2Z2_9SACH|nr:unnamed protein product [Kluyveromyces dobzhanskii CBS 2104]